jgi:hypothetical protein
MRPGSPAAIQRAGCRIRTASSRDSVKLARRSPAKGERREGKAPVAVLNP